VKWKRVAALFQDMQGDPDLEEEGIAGPQVTDFRQHELTEEDADAYYQEDMDMEEPLELMEGDWVEETMIHAEKLISEILDEASAMTAMEDPMKDPTTTNDCMSFGSGKIFILANLVSSFHSHGRFRSSRSRPAGESHS